ncbi:hypothetical protein LJB90_03130 [Eubacteriales bacterium OttesenSCG-928-G02]|nr:hypothetical protein [Eubacteriales bacterium OttesenSCG-928-G02]
MLTFKNYMLLFCYAWVFGASYLIFNIKSIPSAAKRTLHIIVNYVAMLIVFYMIYMIASGGIDTREKLIFIIMATFVFLIIYIIGMIISSLIKKIKN